MQSPNDTYSGETKVQGKFRLSVPTSLALETLFGINDNVLPTNPLPYKQYTYLFINLRTLLRNLYGSVSKELKTIWSVERYYAELLEEIHVLPEIVQAESANQLSVVYYLDSYKSISRLYPHAKLKVGKPASVNLYDAIEQNIVVKLTQAIRAKDISAMLTDCFIPLPESKKERVLIMTHLPLDLVPHSQSTRLDLLESHTGVIKDSVRWYTKLNGKEPRVPFGKFAIQLFGDGKQFSGFPPRYRKAVAAFGEEKRWNQLTSDNLLKITLSKLPERDIYDEIKPIL